MLQDPENTIPYKKRNLEAVFDDATPVHEEGVHDADMDATREKLQTKMKGAFGVMQMELRTLNAKWEYTGKGKNSDADVNFQYFRPLPKDLATGPGY
jgi:hypothetical protein